MHTLRVKNLRKEFKNRVVLQDFSCVIEEGDVFGVIGKSGSGKTTFLTLLGGLVRPTSGSISYVTAEQGLEKDYYKNFSRIKHFIGYMPQQTALYPKLTIAENVLHFGELYGLRKDTLFNNAKSLLELTNLYTLRHLLVEQLSGGMKKRLDLVCSIIHKPRLLILDEPTSDLDPILEQEILLLIKEINKQGTTIVIASHHLEGLETVCNKLAIIHNSALHSYGDIDDVRKPYLKEHTTITIKATKEKEKIISLAKQLPVLRIIDQGHQLLFQTLEPQKTIQALLEIVQDEHFTFQDIDVRKSSLKEIFTRISKE